MKYTTAPPRKNVLEVAPELAVQARTAVRLHPRPGKAAPSDSKIGGVILWPQDRPWPACDGPHWPNYAFLEPDIPEGETVPLTPVLQLRASDFPEIEFLPNTDLLLVFWCLRIHKSPFCSPRPHIFWVNSSRSA